MGWDIQINPHIWRYKTFIYVNCIVYRFPVWVLHCWPYPYLFDFWCLTLCLSLSLSFQKMNHFVVIMMMCCCCVCEITVQISEIYITQESPKRSSLYILFFASFALDFFAFYIYSLCWFCKRANFLWSHGKYIVFERLWTSFTRTVRPRIHFALLSSLKSEVWPLLIYSHIAFKRNRKLCKASIRPLYYWTTYWMFFYYILMDCNITGKKSVLSKPFIVFFFIFIFILVVLNINIVIIVIIIVIVKFLSICSEFLFSWWWGMILYFSVKK